MRKNALVSFPSALQVIYNVDDYNPATATIRSVAVVASRCGGMKWREEGGSASDFEGGYCQAHVSALCRDCADPRTSRLPCY